MISYLYVVNWRNFESASEIYINESVLHYAHQKKTEASPSDCLVSYLGHTTQGGLDPLQRCNC